MEAAVVNLVPRGGKAIVLGRRTVRPPLGRYLPAATASRSCVTRCPGASRSRPTTSHRLLAEHPDAVAVFGTLMESSTGAIHDVQAIGRSCGREHGALWVVDAISGAGAVPLPDRRLAHRRAGRRLAKGADDSARPGHAGRQRRSLAADGTRRAAGVLLRPENPPRQTARRRRSRHALDARPHAHRRAGRIATADPRRRDRGGLARLGSSQPEPPSPACRRMGLELFAQQPGRGHDRRALPEGIDGGRLPQAGRKTASASSWPAVRVRSRAGSSASPTSACSTRWISSRRWSPIELVLDELGHGVTLAPPRRPPAGAAGSTLDPAVDDSTSPITASPAAKPSYSHVDQFELGTAEIVHAKSDRAGQACPPRDSTCWRRPGIEYEVRTGLKGEELRARLGRIRRRHLPQRREDHGRRARGQPSAEGHRAGRRGHRQHRLQGRHPAGHRRHEHAGRQHAQHGRTRHRHDAGPVAQHRPGLPKPGRGPLGPQEVTWAPNWPTRRWASSAWDASARPWASGPRRCKCALSASIRFSPANASAELGIEPAASVAELLPQVDYLTVHTPLTDETRNLIDCRNSKC